MPAHTPTSTLLASSLLLASMAGCTVNGPSVPPIVVTSERPVGMSQRERAYIECASALIRAHPSKSRFQLLHSYQSKLLEERDARLFHIAAYLSDKGKRRKVQFECTTERGISPRVLSLVRLSTLPFES